MKIFKLLFLSIFISGYSLAMEKKEQKFDLFSDLPGDIQKEIIKLAIDNFIDIHGATPEEVFKGLDSLRASNKKIKELFDDVIKRIGKSKTPPDNNYTYLKFKQDYIKDLLNKWQQKINDKVGTNAFIKKRIKAIIDLGAYIYFWDKARTDLEYKNELDGVIFNFQDWKLSESRMVEITDKLLKMGANFTRNPRIFVWDHRGGYNLIRVYPGLFIAVKEKYLPVIKLILNSDPQIDLDVIDKNYQEYQRSTDSRHNILSAAVKTENPEIVKLILARTKNKDSISKALDLAREMLSDKIYSKHGKVTWTAWKATGRGLNFENPDIKYLSEIVKMLKAAK